MHIAVLDDNIADRKQIERLLDRESDKRISTTGNLYADSFGAVDALFGAPRQYEFFMIDLKGPASLSVDIALKLRDIGIKVPICFFRPKEAFSDIEKMPDNVLFLEKPVKVAELSSLIDEVIDLWEKHREEYKFTEDEEEEIPQMNIFKRIVEHFY